MTRLSLYSNIVVGLSFTMFTVKHFFFPATNYDFTKTLLLSFVLVPIFSILLALFHDYLLPQNKKRKQSLFLIFLALFMTLIFSYEILGYVGLVWLLVYLSPLVTRYFTNNLTNPAQEIKRLLLIYFAAMLTSFAVLLIAENMNFSLAVQQEHFDHIWQNYSDGILMMIAICLFTIFNQLYEVRFALKKLSIAI